VTTANGARWVDLGQPWSDHMSFGPVHGRPRLEMETAWRDDHDANCVVSVTRLSASAHTGTHVDAPRHFFADGPSIDDLPLEAFIGDGVVLDLVRPPGGPVTADDLGSATPRIEAGDIVFLRLGFGERFGDDAYRDHPYVTEDAARMLVDRGIRMLGVDTLSPELPHHRRAAGFEFPVHRLLLGAGVLIVENLGPGLRTVAGTRTKLAAIPVRIEGGDAGPAAALGLLPPECAA
jgi:arylformamidase